MSSKPIESMTLEECRAELSSGKFMVSSTKKKLTDRIAYLESIPATTNISTNRFYALNDNQNTEEYPELKLNKSSSLKKSTTIDYSKIISSSTEIKQKSTLLTEGKIHIDYSKLMAIYDSAAIYRIRMHYISLNKKISVINLLMLAGNKYVDYIINKYNFTELIFEEKRVYDTLLMYISLNKLLETFNECYNIVANKKIRDISEFVDAYYQSIMENYYNIYLGEYNNAVSITLYSMNKIVEQLLFATDTEQFINRVKNCIMDIERIIDQLIKENDPHIDCEYYVDIVDDVENPIKLTKLTESYQLDTNANNSISTTIEVLNYDNDQVRVWDLFFIEHIMNYQEILQRNHILTIYQGKRNNMIPHKLHFNIHNKLNLGDTEYVMVIDNLPIGYKYLTSIYKNLPNITDADKYIPIVDIFKVWIDKYVRTEYIDDIDDDLFDIIDGSNDNDSILVNKPITNRDIINRLFGMIIEEDACGELIRINSIGSFRKLAYETTPHNDITVLSQ